MFSDCVLLWVCLLPCLHWKHSIPFFPHLAPSFLLRFFSAFSLCGAVQIPCHHVIPISFFIDLWLVSVDFNHYNDEVDNNNDFALQRQTRFEWHEEG
jgi:hypothetical protein